MYEFGTKFFNTFYSLFASTPSAAGDGSTVVATIFSSVVDTREVLYSSSDNLLSSLESPTTPLQGSSEITSTLSRALLETPGLQTEFSTVFSTVDVTTPGQETTVFETVSSTPDIPGSVSTALFSDMDPSSKVMESESSLLSQSYDESVIVTSTVFLSNVQSPSASEQRYSSVIQSEESYSPNLPVFPTSLFLRETSTVYASQTSSVKTSPGLSRAELSSIFESVKFSTDVLTTTQLSDEMLLPASLLSEPHTPTSAVPPGILPSTLMETTQVETSVMFQTVTLTSATVGISMTSGEFEVSTVSPVTSLESSVPLCTCVSAPPSLPGGLCSSLRCDPVVPSTAMQPSTPYDFITSTLFETLPLSSNSIPIEASPTVIPTPSTEDGIVSETEYLSGYITLSSLSTPDISRTETEYETESVTTYIYQTVPVTYQSEMSTEMPVYPSNIVPTITSVSSEELQNTVVPLTSQFPISLATSTDGSVSIFTQTMELFPSEASTLILYSTEEYSISETMQLPSSAFTSITRQPTLHMPEISTIISSDANELGTVLLTVTEDLVSSLDVTVESDKYQTVTASSFFPQTISSIVGPRFSGEVSMFPSSIFPVFPIVSTEEFMITDTFTLLTNPGPVTPSLTDGFIGTKSTDLLPSDVSVVTEVLTEEYIITETVHLTSGEYTPVMRSSTSMPGTSFLPSDILRSTDDTIVGSTVLPSLTASGYTPRSPTGSSDVYDTLTLSTYVIETILDTYELLPSQTLPMVPLSDSPVASAFTTKEYTVTQSGLPSSDLYLSNPASSQVYLTPTAYITDVLTPSPWTVFASSLPSSFPEDTGSTVLVSLSSFLYETVISSIFLDETASVTYQPPKSQQSTPDMLPPVTTDARSFSTVMLPLPSSERMTVFETLTQTHTSYPPVTYYTQSLPLSSQEESLKTSSIVTTSAKEGYISASLSKELGTSTSDVFDIITTEVYEYVSTVYYSSDVVRVSSAFGPSSAMFEPPGSSVSPSDRLTSAMLSSEILYPSESTPPVFSPIMTPVLDSTLLLPRSDEFSFQTTTITETLFDSSVVTPPLPDTSTMPKSLAISMPLLSSGDIGSMRPSTMFVDSAILSNIFDSTVSAVESSLYSNATYTSSVFATVVLSQGSTTSFTSSEVYPIFLSTQDALLPSALQPTPLVMTTQPLPTYSDVTVVEPSTISLYSIIDILSSSNIPRSSVSQSGLYTSDSLVGGSGVSSTVPESTNILYQSSIETILNTLVTDSSQLLPLRTSGVLPSIVPESSLTFTVTMAVSEGVLSSAAIPTEFMMSSEVSYVSRVQQSVYNTEAITSTQLIFDSVSRLESTVSSTILDRTATPYSKMVDSTAVSPSLELMSPESTIQGPTSFVTKDLETDIFSSVSLPIMQTLVSLPRSEESLVTSESPVMPTSSTVASTLVSTTDFASDLLSESTAILILPSSPSLRTETLLSHVVTDMPILLTSVAYTPSSRTPPLMSLPVTSSMPPSDSLGPAESSASGLIPDSSSLEVSVDQTFTPSLLDSLSKQLQQTSGILPSTLSPPSTELPPLTSSFAAVTASSLPTLPPVTTATAEPIHVPLEFQLIMNINVDVSEDVSDPVFLQTISNGLEVLFIDGLENTANRKRREIQPFSGKIRGNLEWIFRGKENMNLWSMKSEKTYVFKRDGETVSHERQRRDALDPSEEYEVPILNSTRPLSDDMAVVIVFYVLENETLVAATEADAVYDTLTIGAMSAELGYEVIGRPRPIIPTPPTTPDYPFPIPPAAESNWLQLTMVVNASVNESDVDFQRDLRNNLEFLYINGSAELENTSGRRRRRSGVEFGDEDADGGSEEGRNGGSIRNRRAADPSTEHEVALQMVNRDEVDNVNAVFYVVTEGVVVPGETALPPYESFTLDELEEVLGYAVLIPGVTLYLTPADTGWEWWWYFLIVVLSLFLLIILLLCFYQFIWKGWKAKDTPIKPVEKMVDRSTSIELGVLKVDIKPKATTALVLKETALNGKKASSRRPKEAESASREAEDKERQISRSTSSSQSKRRSKKGQKLKDEHVKRGYLSEENEQLFSHVYANAVRKPKTQKPASFQNAVYPQADRLPPLKQRLLVAYSESESEVSSKQLRMMRKAGVPKSWYTTHLNKDPEELKEDIEREKRRQTKKKEKKLQQEIDHKRMQSEIDAVLGGTIYEEIKNPTVRKLKESRTDRWKPTDDPVNSRKRRREIADDHGSGEIPVKLVTARPLESTAPAPSVPKDQQIKKEIQELLKRGTRPAPVPGPSFKNPPGLTDAEAKEIAEKKDREVKLRRKWAEERKRIERILDEAFSLSSSTFQDPSTPRSSSPSEKPSRKNPAAPVAAGRNERGHGPDRGNVVPLGSLDRQRYTGGGVPNYDYVPAYESYLPGMTSTRLPWQQLGSSPMYETQLGVRDPMMDPYNQRSIRPVPLEYEFLPSQFRSEGAAPAYGVSVSPLRTRGAHHTTSPYPTDPRREILRADLVRSSEISIDSSLHPMVVPSRTNGPVGPASTHRQEGGGGARVGGGGGGGGGREQSQEAEMQLIREENASMQRRLAEQGRKLQQVLAMIGQPNSSIDQLGSDATSAREGKGNKNGKGKPSSARKQRKVIPLNSTKPVDGRSTTAAWVEKHSRDNDTQQTYPRTSTPTKDSSLALKPKSSQKEGSIVLEHRVEKQDTKSV
ncbi:uncharacterized protein [Diadema antillarum]|uniref:uncharacterized protein n=1 Tax=Diadema antillarum TaxID=105358 RepID=UPI003A83A29F